LPTDHAENLQTTTTRCDIKTEDHAENFQTTTTSCDIKTGGEKRSDHPVYFTHRTTSIKIAYSYSKHSTALQEQ